MSYIVAAKERNGKNKCFLGGFFNTNFSNTVWFVSPTGLCDGYASILQVDPFLDFSLGSVYIYVGMIVSTKRGSTRSYGLNLSWVQLFIKTESQHIS